MEASRLRQSAALLALLCCLCLFCSQTVQDSAIQLQEDCASGQYFDSLRLRCRNCSDSIQLFRSYSDFVASHELIVGDNNARLDDVISTLNSIRLRNERQQRLTAPGSSGEPPQDEPTADADDRDKSACECPYGYFMSPRASIMSQAAAANDQLLGYQQLLRCIRCPKGYTSSASGFECVKCISALSNQRKRQNGSFWSSVLGFKAATAGLSLHQLPPLNASTSQADNQDANNSAPKQDGNSEQATVCLRDCRHVENAYLGERVSEASGLLEHYCHVCPPTSRPNHQLYRCEPCRASTVYLSDDEQDKLQKSSFLSSPEGDVPRKRSNNNFVPVQQRCYCELASGSSIAESSNHCYDTNEQSFAAAVGEILHEPGTNKASATPPSSKYLARLTGDTPIAKFNLFGESNDDTSDGSNFDEDAERQVYNAGKSRSAKGAAGSTPSTSLGAGDSLYAASSDQELTVGNSGDEEPTAVDSDKSGNEGDEGEASIGKHDRRSLVDEIITSKGAQISWITRELLQSAYLATALPTAVAQCKYHRNITACQLWSNLCVLAMYEHGETATSSGYSDDELRPRRSIAPRGTTTTLPSSKTWQASRRLSTVSVCNALRRWIKLDKEAMIAGSAASATSLPPSPSLPTASYIYLSDGSFDESSFASYAKQSLPVLLKLNQNVQFLAYKYSLDGRLLKVEPFDLDDLAKFCPLNAILNAFMSDGSQSIKLGKNMRLKCTVNGDHVSKLLASGKKQLMDMKETVFIDLYVIYQLNGVMYSKPVPVLIKNLLFNGHQVNRRPLKEQSRWKLVRRFYYFASLELPNDTNVLRFAKSVSLDLRFKPQDKGLLMFTPTLTLDYSFVVINSSMTANMQQASSNEIKGNINQIYETSIRLQQHLIDSQAFKKTFELILGVSSIVGLVVAIFKCYNLCKRHGAIKLNLNSLFKLILMYCATMADILVIDVLFSIGFLYINLKLYPAAMRVMAPSDELEASLISSIQLALLLKLLSFATQCYWRLNADIFFIDWERPKMLMPFAAGKQANSVTRENSKAGNNINDSGVEADKIAQAVTLSSDSSSFWRPYSVIARWHMLQTMRRFDITLHLFVLAYIVEVTQLLTLATTSDPGLSFVKHQRQNILGQQWSSSDSQIFKIFVLSVVYLVLALAQLLYQHLIHLPLLKDASDEFVDLCSVANVSLFGMLHPRFGFYIHGRNVNGSSDCSIAEMNACLEREERNLCSRRGLAPDSDLQTFLVILPRIINDHYRKLLSSNSLFNSSPSQLQFNGGVQSISSQQAESLLRLPFGAATMSSSFVTNRPIIEVLVARNKAINNFLRNFLEHSYKDIDYTIRDARTSEKFLFDVNLDQDEDDVAHMSSFTQLHHHQNGFANGLSRTTAATFCNDTYLQIDFTISSAMITWILVKTFELLYSFFARRNLIAKCAIDEKFLIT